MIVQTEEIAEQAVVLVVVEGLEVAGALQAVVMSVNRLVVRVQ